MSGEFRAKKIYHLASAASLGLIAWALANWGETNLPPLIPAVRYVILALYANYFLSYALFVSDPEIANEEPAGWIWLALIGAGLAFIPPVFSGDLWEYLVRGRILGIYHQSPYIAIPMDFPSDLLRPYSVAWAHNPDSYGPLSVYLQTLPVLVFTNSIPGMLWAYKAMVLAFYGAAILFFWKIAEYLRLPGWPRLWAMFAYCPLLVVTGLIDGHNDMIMMAFSIASLYFLLCQRYGRAFLFWSCAFLVKYMVAIQLPFMIVYAVRKEWKRRGSFPWLMILGQTAMNTVFIAAAFAPLWGGIGTFLAILRQKDAFYTNTVPYLFHFVLQKFGVALDPHVVKTAFLGTFLAFYLCLLVKSMGLAEKDFRSFFRLVALAYLAFYAALPSPIGYWYLCWPLFWIILSGWPKDLWLVILYSLVGVLSFYKRPNFLAAIALVLYVAVALPPLFKGRMSRS